MTALPTTAYVQFGADGVAEVQATVRLNGHSHVYCHLYDDSAPILAVDDAHVRLSVSVPDPDQVTTEDLAWGRRLAEAVGRYIAELERRVSTGLDSAADSGGCAGQAA